MRVTLCSKFRLVCSVALLGVCSPKRVDSKLKRTGKLTKVEPFDQVRDLFGKLQEAPFRDYAFNFLANAVYEDAKEDVRG